MCCKALHHINLNIDETEQVLIAGSCMQMTVLMLMLAGSDTSQLSHKVLLGVLPDLPPAIVERLREEQRAVVARHGPALTRAAVSDMVWADAMAREVLRLRGPAEGLFRCACVNTPKDKP